MFKPNFYNGDSDTDSDDMPTPKNNVLIPILKQFMYANSDADYNINSDTDYSSDFESESESEYDCDNERYQPYDNFVDLVNKYDKLKKFDDFCLKYYSAKCIVSAIRKWRQIVQKKKTKMLFESLYKQEQERRDAIEASKQFLKKQQVHQKIMNILFKSITTQDDAKENDQVNDVENKQANVVKTKTTIIIEPDRENEMGDVSEVDVTNRLNINLDIRKEQIKTLIEEDEKEMELEKELKEEMEKEVNKELEEEMEREICNQREREEIIAREMKIMREQELLYMKRERRRLLENMLENKLHKISAEATHHHNLETREKLKKISRDWDERHKLNEMWSDIRKDIIQSHHKKQFKPVLNNLLRHVSYKENNNDWILVADELKKKFAVNKVTEKKSWWSKWF